MKLVHIITRSDVVGGAPVHVRDLSLALLRRNHDVTVLVGGKGPFIDELRKCRIPHVSLKYLQREIHPLRDCLALSEIVRVLRGLRPDLVAAHTAKAGSLGRMAATMLRLPSVYTPHGWSIGDKISARAGVLFCAVERALAGVTENIINVCEAERNLAIAKRVGAPENLAVIHNGIPDSPERANPSAPTPRIVMVARFDPKKDHETLLRALSTLCDLPWELELIGTGPNEEYIRSLTTKLGLDSRVCFAGARNDVARRLAAAQLFVLTTKTEGFPISVLEAMRAGLPVLATATNGIPEQVVHGETGLLVGKGDEHGVRTALRLLLGDPGLRARLGAAGRRLYEARFTFEQMFRNTLAIYENVVGAQTALEMPSIAA